MNRHTKHSNAHVRNWFFLIILFGVIVLLIYSLVNAGKNIKVSNQNLKKYEAEYEEIYKRGESVAGLLENFEDDFGFEKYVRENFGVVKLGEKVVIVTRLNKKSNEPSNSEIGQDE